MREVLVQNGGAVVDETDPNTAGHRGADARAGLLRPLRSGSVRRLELSWKRKCASLRRCPSRQLPLDDRHQQRHGSKARIRTEAQTQILSPKLGPARHGSFALTERVPRSDAASLRTTDVARWRLLYLNGSKPISQSTRSEHLHGDGGTDPGKPGLGHFALSWKKDTPGLSWEKSIKNGTARSITATSL